MAITFPTTTTSAAPVTTRPLEERLAATPVFWTALGTGDAAGPPPPSPAEPAAVDFDGLRRGLRPGFTVTECVEFAADAVQCSVAVTSIDLLTIGATGPTGERLLVADDGWFGVPAVLGSAAARLSLYALEAHTAEVRVACPVTDNPQAPRLAIVGSATAACGAYLVSLIPEYLAAQDLSFGPPG